MFRICFKSRLERWISAQQMFASPRWKLIIRRAKFSLKFLEILDAIEAEKFLISHVLATMSSENSTLTFLFLIKGDQKFETAFIYQKSGHPGFLPMQIHNRLFSD
jgi:hypothetical protein